MLRVWCGGPFSDRRLVLIGLVMLVRKVMAMLMILTNEQYKRTTNKNKKCNCNSDVGGVGNRWGIGYTDLIFR